MSFEMFSEPEFWVAVAFFILMGVFAYLGVGRSHGSPQCGQPGPSSDASLIA